MTTKQVPALGQIPGASDRRPGLGAPLPMVTQQMRTSDVIPVDSARPTMVSNPLSQLEASTAAVLFGKQPNATMVQISQERPRPVGPPPEIGLTEHALPTDSRPDPRLALMIDADSERSASFRVLRHHLLEVGRPQCVVVSSPRQGDGKTTTAINLALALAECGRAKVLLVEAHLRRPQLAGVFKFLPPWCFAEQLAAHRHQPNMPWNFIDIPQLWLHVAAVNPKIEKTQLLDGPAFSIALDRLRLGGYDHIVIDAPPVLGSADVNLMADAADTVLLAVRSRSSTTRDLRKAIEQLGASSVAGTVLVED